MSKTVSFSDLIGSLPPIDAAYLDFADGITAALEAGNAAVAVLDDDPTGFQTVCDCLWLTRWDIDLLKQGLQDRRRIFYVLTNTRACGADSAARINRQCLENLVRANREIGRRLIVISRSDSTLRGHFPLEVDVLREVWRRETGSGFDGVVLAPAFFEGGRYTVGDIHYVREGDHLIPADETEFARDPVFGYSHSRLPEYVEEKTNGGVKASEVETLAVEEIRCRPISHLAGRLCDLRGLYLCVNAADYSDLNKVSAAILEAAARGRTFLIRSAASIAKTLGGIRDSGLLEHSDLKPGTAPGIVVVGSHVKRTTDQLDELLTRADVAPVRVDVQHAVADAGSCARSLSQVIEKAASKGLTPVVFTSREVVRRNGETQQLEFGRAVSRFLVGLVRGLRFKPGFLIAKGGITASDIATDALRISSARVLGQILPGVPVVRTPDDCRVPAVPYVIFPGNVGDKGALAAAYEKLAYGQRS